MRTEMDHDGGRNPGGRSRVDVNSELPGQLALFELDDRTGVASNWKETRSETLLREH